MLEYRSSIIEKLLNRLKEIKICKFNKEIIYENK